MIHIRTFRATEDPEACAKFIDGHKRLLEIYYGIAKVTSSSEDWVNDPSTIVVLVEDDITKKVYGGARVQQFNGKNSLPVEVALGKYDKNIYNLVKERCGEVCGMWNSKEIAGMGIGSHILCRVSVAITTRLPLDKIYVLCAPVTTRMGRRIGAIVEESLGDKGIFFYPHDDFVATAMVIPDLDTLIHAQDTERELIYNLRNNPIQTRTEKGPKGEFEVHYNLSISPLAT